MILFNFIREHLHVVFVWNVFDHESCSLIHVVPNSSKINVKRIVLGIWRTAFPFPNTELKWVFESKRCRVPSSFTLLRIVGLIKEISIVTSIWWSQRLKTSKRKGMIWIVSVGVKTYLIPWIRKRREKVLIVMKILNRVMIVAAAECFVTIRMWFTI